MSPGSTVAPAASIVISMPADHPLWHFPNVIITPHISGSKLSTHFKTRFWDILVENVSRHIAGKPLMNELTTKQLAGG